MKEEPKICNSLLQAVETAHQTDTSHPVRQTTQSSVITAPSNNESSYLPLPMPLRLPFPQAHLNEIIEQHLSLFNNADHQQQQQHIDASNNHIERQQQQRSSASAVQRGRGGRAVRDTAARAEAMKEKNRRAQQRFRHRQKERMEMLELEVTRLRALLKENGIEYSSILPSVNLDDDIIGMDDDCGGIVIDMNSNGGGGDHHIPIVQHHNINEHILHTNNQQSPSSPQLSVDDMNQHIEQWIDECPTIDKNIAIRYLQRWLSDMNDDIRRLHYRALMKRHSNGNVDNIEMWIKTEMESSSI